MKIKGKSVYNNEDALEFAKGVRGQYIISQALTIASRVLKEYESELKSYTRQQFKEDLIPHELISKCEPSNRTDMEFLILAFPLYRIHDAETWTEEMKREVLERYTSDEKDKEQE